MPEPTVAPKDPTILSAPEPVVPKSPEEKLFNPVIPEPTAPAAPETKPEVPAEPQEKPTEPKPPTEPAKVEEKPSTPPAPTDYVLALPKDSPLSPEDLADTQKKAKEAGLTKEQAEGVLGAKDESVRAFVNRQEQLVAKAKQEWREAAAKDPIIGGEKFQENAELARRGFHAVADLELQNLVEQTGWGNHPAVLRAFVKLGKMMSEDRLVRGDVGAPPKGKSREEILYGGTTPGVQEPMH